MENEKSFLGRGWKFPPAFDKHSSTVRMSEAVQDIEESIQIILRTTPGERIMQPEFGCFLNKLVFEKNDTSLFAELSDMIYYSLLNFEPRIKDINTEVTNFDELNGILFVNIQFTIIITNTRHNVVFPFYRLEGTNISNYRTPGE